MAYSPRMVDLGGEPAHDVRLELHPYPRAWLEGQGCRVWPGTPRVVAPHGDLPPATFAVGIPLELFDARPAGWLPIFETAQTSRDLDRPGVWECGVPSDLVFGVCTYGFAAGGSDHYLALPFDRIYVPSGWSPPPALVDTDGN